MQEVFGVTGIQNESWISCEANGCFFTLPNLTKNEKSRVNSVYSGPRIRSIDLHLIHSVPNSERAGMAWSAIPQAISEWEQLIKKRTRQTAPFWLSILILQRRVLKKRCPNCENGTNAILGVESVRRLSFWLKWLQNQTIFNVHTVFTQSDFSVWINLVLF